MRSPLLFLCILFSLNSAAQNPLEDSIQSLIDQMTVAQKIDQLHRNTFWTTPDNPALGIPGFTMSDGPHGVRFVDATSFPVGIGIAASWNRDLAFEVGSAMGREFHAYGKHQQLGPALDLCRDPRNGRSPETGGEDPFLCAHMNIPLVRGIQTHPTIATIKHFNGVNRQVDRHNADINMSYRQMMEHYGYNFRRVMQDAGPLSLMNAYNKINGDKCAENSELLTHVLRDRWGFPFYVVSDWGSVWDAAKALKAGCDVEMDIDVSSFEEQLQNQFTLGEIDESDLDRAIRRELRVKFLTGMMDNFPAANPFTGANTPEHQALALQSGREAIVLLKNEDEILPITNLDATVAIIGPSAQVAQLDGFGSSWVDPPYAVTPFEGLANKIPESQITYAMGCAINSSDTSGFAAARSAALAADYVLFVGGLDDTQEGENFWPGPVDRTGGSVELPYTQQLLIAELAEANPNVIVVLKSGGICAVPSALESMKGFVYAFYPGMEGGNAIADVLYGDYNPSGKLPVTMPTGDAQMPAWNDDFSDDFNCGYRFYDEMGSTPQFAFGHGLSYTSFAYNNMQVNASSVTAGEPITVSIDVTNTGAVDGSEVVQLYLENNAAPVWLPTKELKGFEKVHLAAGATETITFTLTANELYYFDTDLDAYTIALGDYVLRAGGASDQLPESVTVSITAGVPAPDLEVTRIYSYPRFPAAGDSVLFLALVKNQGTQDILPDMPLHLVFEVDGIEVSSSTSIADTLYAGGAILIGANQGVSGLPFWVPDSNGTYTVTAVINPNGDFDELISSNNATDTDIEVTDPDQEIVPNLCYLKPATATSAEDWNLDADKAVDGDFSTRWSSLFEDPQTITVDLLDVYTLNVIALAWETAYSSEYKLEVSVNGTDWTLIVHDTNADGGNDLFYPELDARYIRVEGIERATEWGHSLFEIQSYGVLANADGVEETGLADINIYPNPTTEEFHVSGFPEGTTVYAELYDMNGHILLAQSVNNGNAVPLPVSLSAGMYVVRLKGNGVEVVRHLMVR